MESDEVLVASVQKGNTEAFGSLMARYEQKLLRYGRKFLSRKEDIEDIVQDAFVSAFQNIQSFDTSLRFSPWMYRIAHNAFVNELRRTQRRPLLAFNFDELVAHHVYEDPDAEIREREENQRYIDAGLERTSLCGRFELQRNRRRARSTDWHGRHPIKTRERDAQKNCIT